MMQDAALSQRSHFNECTSIDALTISVILPVYNRAHCIAAALESVLFQLRPVDELILVDDGSTDQLEAAVRPYMDRLRFIRQPNRGVSRARNAGAEVARGSWLAFQDSDDLWAPRHVATLLRDIARADTQVVAHIGDVVYSGLGYRRRLFEIKGFSFPSDHAEQLHSPLSLVLSGMTLQGAAVRRDVWLRLGGLDETMHLYEDSAFFLRLAQLGAFLVTGQEQAEIRRLEETFAPLSALERHDSVAARQLWLRALNGVDRSCTSAAEKHLLDRATSGALFVLAEALHRADSAAARAQLLASARCHPNSSVGWIKAMAALLLGKRGYEIVLRRRKAIDRTL